MRRGGCQGWPLCCLFAGSDDKFMSLINQKSTNWVGMLEQSFYLISQPMASIILVVSTISEKDKEGLSVEIF